MNNFEWHFQLDGQNVNSLSDLVEEQAQIVKDANGQTHLVAKLPHDLEAPWEAKKDGEALLARLNAVAHVAHGNHSNLKIVGVGCKDPATGQVNDFILAPSFSSTSFIGMVIVGDGTPQKKVGDKFLAAAAKDEDLKRAQEIYGSVAHDWKGLYMVLDAAIQGHNDQQTLIDRKWVPQGHIKKFKHTADNYRATGNMARHGKTNLDPPKVPMTLEEARSMMRTILRKWVESLA